MTLPELLFLLVVFIANTFEAMTGFGGTLLAMPTSMILIGVDEAKTILNTIALLGCSWIAIRNRQHINKKELAKITGLMLIGLIIGIIAFDALSINYLLKFYAILIILIALKNLFYKKRIQLPALFMIVVVVIAGIIHGLFLSGGSLLVIYALYAFKDKGEFRATLATVWAILDAVMLVNQARLGHLNSETGLMIFIAMIPLAFAILLGNRLHHKINQQTFVMLTYILLVISGFSLLLK